MKKYVLTALLSVGIFCDAAFSQGTHEPVAQKVPNINSKADDFGSVLSKDGLTMYFTTNRFGKTHIYAAKRKSLDGEWSEPEYRKIAGNQDVIGSIALDDIGRFYFATNRETREPGDFNIWEGFGLDSTPTARVLSSPINTVRWESHPTVTAEGKDLYFASTRNTPAGANQLIADIYVSHRSSDGSWTEPAHLGPNINFGVFNGTPFISPDGRFLLFTSIAKIGPQYKRKIYIAEHTGPKDDDWSQPVLMPAPINSEKDDMFPWITPDAKMIYFSSNRDGSTGFDIYQMELPPKIQALIYESFVKK